MPAAGRRRKNGLNLAFSGADGNLRFWVSQAEASCFSESRPWLKNEKVGCTAFEVLGLALFFQTVSAVGS